MLKLVITLLAFHHVMPFVVQPSTRAAGASLVVRNGFLDKLMNSGKRATIKISSYLRCRQYSVLSPYKRYLYFNRPIGRRRLEGREFPQAARDFAEKA